MGGSAILGYDLWRDDGLDGDFVPIFIMDSILAVTYLDSDVVQGRTYRYKYRARNVSGYSLFSEAAYLFAASVPSKPEPPLMTGVTRDTISLKFFSPVDTGGTNILSYTLEMD